MRVNVARTLTLLAALLIPLSVAAAAKMPFEIAAGEAPDALREFGRQARLQLLFEYRLVRDLKTRAVMGDFEREDALVMLLNGTGLTFEFVNERTVAIHSGARTFAETTGDGSGDAAGRINGWLDRFRLAQADQSKRDETPESSTRSAQSSSETSEKRVLEEVIVTAQKREENLHDVPLSITAISAEEINRRGMVSSGDYLRGIPGVNQIDDQFGQNIVIRGIEVSPRWQNYSAGTTTATYFGEVPTTNSAGIASGTAVDIKLVDIARVEVLRGPQGTAFGNSSLGGAVRTIPNPPKLDGFEANVGASYSATERDGGGNDMLQGTVNLPIVTGKLAFRASAYRFYDAGYYKNRAGSDPATLTAVAAYGGEEFAIDADHVGTSEYAGARAVVLFQPIDDLKFTLTYLTQTTKINGTTESTLPGYEQNLLAVAPEHVRRGQRGGLSDSDIHIANAVVEYDLGWANLLGTYTDTRSGSIYTNSYSTFPVFDPNRPGSNLSDSDHREHVAEVRLVTQLASRLNGIVGVYHERIKDDALVNDLVWHGDPATNPRFPGVQDEGIALQNRELEQTALFGELSWKFLDNFTLTGGVRNYRYDRDSDSDFSGPIFGAVNTREVAKASGNTFRGNLSYKPDESALLYAGWAQGFRLGVPQAGLPSGLCDSNGDGIIDGTNGTPIASTRQTQSDFVDSYELGIKKSMLGRRVTVEGALFRIDWQDMPMQTVAPPQPDGCNLTYVANVGAARSEGVELQLNAYLTEAVRVDVGGSWIDAKLTQDVPTLGASSGDRLPASPKVNANLSLQYEFNLSGRDAYVRADSIYVGPFYGSLTTLVPGTKSGGYVKVDLSFRMAVMKNLDLDLFARNLTNEDAFVFRGPFDQGDFVGWRLRPRTVGLQLGYTF